MKIKKFTESTENTDIFSKLDELKKQELEYYKLVKVANIHLREVNKGKSELFPIFETYLKEYLLINPSLLDDETEIEDIENQTKNGIRIKNIDLGATNEDYLTVEYYIDYTNGLTIDFTKKQFEDFIKFTEDPEIYKDINKYNL